jgi:hypothetical protein
MVVAFKYYLTYLGDRKRMPNFVLTRNYRVPGRRSLLEETLELRNRQTINKIYDSWWSDLSTVRIQLIERKMDSTELIRADSRT